MKLTKSQLKKIIKEELDGYQAAPRPRDRHAQNAWNTMIKSIAHNYGRARLEAGAGEDEEFNPSHVKEFVASLADDVIAQIAKVQADYDAHVEEFGEPDIDDMTSGGLR